MTGAVLQENAPRPDFGGLDLVPPSAISVGYPDNIYRYQVNRSDLPTRLKKLGPTGLTREYQVNLLRNRCGSVQVRHSDKKVESVYRKPGFAC